MEKEIFECDEFEKGQEVQSFPAEDYRGIEIEPSGQESFSSEETSTSSAAKKETKDAYAKAQRAALKGTSTGSGSSSAASAGATSASAGASVASGITGVVVSATVVTVAAVTGVVVLPGVSDNPLFGGEVTTSEVVKPALPEIGTFGFQRYRVQYYPNGDGDDVNATATFFFAGEKNPVCQYSLVDLGQDIAYFIEKTEVEAPIANRQDARFEYRVEFENQLLYSFPITVEDHYLPSSTPFDYSSRITYNDDGTTNAYVYFKPSVEGEFSTRIQIDSPYPSSDYECFQSGDVYSITNIAEPEYAVRLVSDYVVEGNLYSFMTLEPTFYGDRSLEWAAEASNQHLTLSFGSPIQGEVNATILYDDDASESFSFRAEDLVDGEYHYACSRIAEHFSLTFLARADLYFDDPSGWITDTVGEPACPFEITTDVNPAISSLKLEKLEVFDESYGENTGDGALVPVNLRFQGSLLPGDTYSVRVFNEDGTEVDSLLDQTEIRNPVTFKGLSFGSTYTFRYSLFSEGTELFVDEVTQTLSIPTFEGLPSYYCVTPSPSDAYVTYHDDGTSDVYFYMDVQETTLDMYYIIKLVAADSGDDPLYYEVAGTDPVAVFENLVSAMYSIQVATMVNQNGVAYSVVPLQWYSGTVVVGQDAEGYYPDPNAISLSFDDQSQTLMVNLYGRLDTDLTVHITPTSGDPASLNVPLSEVTVSDSHSFVEVDLSAYALSPFVASVEGQAAFGLGRKSDIIPYVVPSGNESCPFKKEINIETGVSS
ncbi:MAG: hypothetical protein SOV58_06680 [Candidatus Enteromonas sp.]|nr:hypothetical protein [Candidatus Enteromonas sp.]